MQKSLVKNISFSVFFLLILFSPSSFTTAHRFESPAFQTGQIFSVDVTNDVADDNPGDGICRAIINSEPHCTFRAAVEEANASSGVNTIEFNIPGAVGGVRVIIFTSQLPPITEPIIIDGYTQNGASEATAGNTAAIKIDLRFPTQGTGLQINGGNSLIRGVSIYYATDAIALNSNGNTIIGNHVAANGSAWNDASGIHITGANNTIGGLTPNLRNVISRNFDSGIFIDGVGATGNVIIGNYIGTNNDGTGDNGSINHGVYILNAPNNTVGGTSAGSRNIITGNDTTGVRIEGSTASGNQILGNYIGLDVTGNDGMGNYHGIHILNAPNNTVGGTSTAARNVISWNGSGGSGIGVYIEGIVSTGNTVLGNYIGLNAAGNADWGNGRGILILNAPGNTIGGTATGAGNVISGSHFSGLQIEGSSASGNQVLGNLIGLDAAGNAAIPNGFNTFHGVYIFNAPNNIIGGAASGARNIISGNTGNGINLEGANASGNQILGNIIGLNLAGNATIPNMRSGIWVRGAPNTIIGGQTTGTHNIISGNGVNGIQIDTNGANGTQVLGNIIGLNAMGTAALGNAKDGIHIEVVSNTTIGGAADNAGNIISGNGNFSNGSNEFGIYAYNATNTQIFGNIIGLNAAGTAAIPNSEDGIHLEYSVGGVIGGTADGAGNVVSGNGRYGVMLRSYRDSGHLVQGNIVGLNAAGTTAVGNISHGIYILDVYNNDIGGTSDGAGNVISGNGGDGINMESTDNVVQGNIIGLNAAGNADRGNAGHGIEVSWDSERNLIGGTTASAANVIAGNNSSGIFLDHADTTTVQRNWIGTNADLDTGLGNDGHGIHIKAGVSNIIGGTADGVGNTITRNGQAGVILENFSFGNRILSNSIYLNGGLGIDLLANNNNNQAAPVLTTVMRENADLLISGTLNSAGSTNFRIEFFGSAACDPSGSGEGQTYLGFINVTTNASGLATFNPATMPFVSGQGVITATATRANNDSSKFSNCIIAPEDPAGLAPTRNVYTINRPTLTWNRISWATSYQIEVADNANFNNAISLTSATLDVQPVSDLGEGLYYWRVRGVGPDGAGAWSVPDRFVIDLP